MVMLDDTQVRDKLVRLLKAPSPSIPDLDRALRDLPATQRQRVLTGGSAQRLLSRLDSYSLFRETPSAVICLLAHGLDPNARDGENMPLLYLATNCGSRELVARLLNSSADPNMLTPRGVSALFGVSFGLAADPNHQRFVCTYAEQQKVARMAELLLGSGADPNGKTDNLADQPLWAMAHKGCWMGAITLIRHGASGEGDDGQGGRRTIMECVRLWLEGSLASEERTLYQDWLRHVEDAYQDLNREQCTLPAVGARRSPRL